jgi:endonuclease/exonuclease/phosphatase (EEP) superfamily protein YafD
VLGTWLIIYPPEIYFFKALSSKAVILMFFLLASVLGSLILGMRKVMFACVFSCALLALFLKVNSNSQLLATPEAEPDKDFLKVAQFNAQDLGNNTEGTLSMINEIDADIIFVQELTPLWSEAITEEFKTEYPHHKSFIRIDLFGMAIYSKYRFIDIDTFMYDQIPNFIGSIAKDHSDEVFHFVSTHITPPLNQSGINKMSDHLALISNKVRSIGQPVLALGNFNAVAWSNELQTFRRETELLASRRGGLGPFFNASSVLEAPVNYIFHSQNLRCLSFGNISNTQAEEVGIFGIYQVGDNKGT